MGLARTGGGAGAFTDGSVYLGSTGSDCSTSTSANGRDYGTSNYYCNPSRIDGVSIINSSQGGGAILVHGWDHNLEIANNRLSANHGTLTGGISLGNGETPPVFINLDMEEYRDLALTAEAFMRTLERPGLECVSAGIALQAYIPDSAAVQRTINEWARDRVARGGADRKSVV